MENPNLMVLVKEVVCEEHRKIMDYPAKESQECAGMEKLEDYFVKVRMKVVVTLMEKSFLQMQELNFY